MHPHVSDFDIKLLSKPVDIPFKAPGGQLPEGQTGLKEKLSSSERPRNNQTKLTAFIMLAYK